MGTDDFGGLVGPFFLPAFPVHKPDELEHIGALGDGGKWVCGLSQQDYSVGTSASPMSSSTRTHRSKRSYT